MRRARFLLLSFVLAALAVAPPAVAQDPAPTQAPLSPEFPGGDDEEPTPTPTPTPTAEPTGTATAEPTATAAPEDDEDADPELANTGAEPLVVALGGLGLLLAGCGIRRNLAGDGRVA